jgi:hypothetical protein
MVGHWVRPCFAAEHSDFPRARKRRIWAPARAVLEALPMYFIVIALFMLILPAGCVAAEYLWLHTGTDLVTLVGKWFAFWGVGMRLGLAGLRQAFDPAFTASDIFEIEDARVHPIVRELGFANLAMATLGIMALSGWAAPAALAGGVFFALAGWKHLAAKERNATRTVAMVSDLFMALVLFAYLAFVVMRAL